ncbi:MAG TPA: carbohydrate kinase [Gemmataceae bacterium]|nr:carbohydrate kinase [Gemmataceae bacterium]
MASDRPLIVAVGEVLWDLLPGGRQLGGAPANFAYHAAQLGADARIVSAVGQDDLGREILAQLVGLGLDVAHVSVEAGNPTGTVTVALAAGQPTYAIHQGVAWDFIPTTPAVLELASRADCVCFGTLAQRDDVSRDTIRTVLARTRPETVRIFDVNFRQHYYDRDVVDRSLRSVTALKINEDEVATLSKLLELAGSPFERFPDLRLVAVTRGARGSELRTREGRVSEHPGERAEPFVDAVGAGDAFTAALAIGLMRGLPLDRVNAIANRVAAYVCTRAGATPQMPPELVAELRG